MILRHKKYKTQASNAPYPHIGQLLQQYFVQHHTNKAALARSLDISSGVMNDYPKRASLQMGIIWKISLATQHNFIAQLAQALPIAYTTPTEIVLQAQIQELQNQLADAQKELAVYRKIVG